MRMDHGPLNVWNQDIFGLVSFLFIAVALLLIDLVDPLGFVFGHLGTPTHPLRWSVEIVSVTQVGDGHFGTPAPPLCQW